MKNLFYLFIVLVVSTYSYAQEASTFSNRLEQLMEAKDGDKIYARLIEQQPSGIEISKHLDFKQNIQIIAQDNKAEAIAYFTEKYSLNDINEIYSEFTTEGIINYSEKTLTFIREWRRLKGKFQKEYKELYLQY